MSKEAEKNPKIKTDATPATKWQTATVDPKEGVELFKRYLYRCGPVGVEEPGYMKNDFGETKAHCGRVPIRGYVLDSESNVREMPDEHGEMKEIDHSMMSFYLTAPCVGIKDGLEGEELVQLQKGDVIIVTQTGSIGKKSQIHLVAKHPEKTVEIYIRPPEKMSRTKKGFKFREWEVRLLSAAPIERAKLRLPSLAGFALPSGRGADVERNGLRQLPSHEEAADIPF